MRTVLTLAAGLLAILLASPAQAARLRLQAQADLGLAAFEIDNSNVDYEGALAMGLQLGALIEVTQGVSVGLMYGYLASGPHDNENNADIQIDGAHSMIGPVVRADFESAVFQAFVGAVQGDVETTFGPFTGKFDDEGWALGLMGAWAHSLSPATSVELGPYFTYMNLTPENPNNDNDDADYFSFGLAVQLCFSVLL